MDGGGTRKRGHRWLVVALWAAVWGPTVPSSAAEIGIYFDPSGDSSSLEESSGSEFEFFVVARGAHGGIRAFEMGLRLDALIQVTSAEIVGGSPVNLGSGLDNWIVGLGDCQSADPAVLVRFRGILLIRGASASLELTGSNPSSSTSQQPAWVDCSGGGVTDFEVVNAAMLNPDERSWGAVKRLYE